MKRLYIRFTMLLSVVSVLVALSAFAFATIAAAEWIDSGSEEPAAEPQYSHRLIVELQTPPLAVQYVELPSARSSDGRVDPRSATAQSYIQQLQAEQAALMATIQTVLPQARMSTYMNEQGVQIQQSFQVVLNAVVVEPGINAGEAELETLRKLPNVKAVYRDYAYYPQLYTSTHLINADTVWSTLGGQADAGRGIKVASVDGGIHHEAPMFSGEGFSYPPGYPEGGLGLTANNNGKIIVSRAYFRSWDPPAPGDENPWPGEQGTSHGVHTSGIAAGNVVTDATYLGTPLPPLSGVAPGAWLGSYRVFYESVNGDGSFYTAEGIAALEDVVKDGMDVVNNSWGGGPASIGGEFDALDTALINAVNAGVFVSMSAGNAGPYPGTGDHPSPDYINVAASTTGGTYAAGRFGVSGPGDVISETLKNIPFATASFGASIEPAQTYTYTYIAAANVGNGSNVEGCNPWPAGTFDGHAAVISRGACEFGLKVLNAEQAGATFVVVYNTAAGGDELISMGPGEDGDQVTIPSIFVGHTAGTAIVAWQTQNPADAEFTLDTNAFQAGATADQIVSFSSRGPSTRNTLKPDIAAPGSNIMSQGYDSLATGEGRHLGFGQVSGTSMASPHVAGAAALLLQAHPVWTPAEIKSALMSTAKYTDVYNYDGTPAQPTDMGAGRLDVAAAMDPGVILMPPSADMGLVVTGTTESVAVQVKNITDGAETYTIDTLFTGNGFAPTQTTSLMGVTVSPTQVTLQPGQVATVTVDFDPAQGKGFNFNQGYIVMQGDQHSAHMPFFARVVEGLGSSPVLIIDTDLSGAVFGTDYAGYYTTTLENLGIPYDYLDTVDYIGSGLSRTIADFASLAKYQAILLFSGDNFYPDGSFTVATPLTQNDMDLLNEYVQAGGTLVVMGQDFASMAGSTDPNSASFFYGATLGATYLQDSVTDEELPSLPVVPLADAPPAFDHIFLDLTGPDRFLGQVALTGANEVPPVDNSGDITGVASFAFDQFTNQLAYEVEIEVAEPFTLTNAHIHSGTVGISGPPVHPTWPFTMPQVVTDTISWKGGVVLTAEQQVMREQGALYFNVHSSANTGGEIRGQVPSIAVVADGAGNQFYIDEIAYDGPLAQPDDPAPPFVGLLRYPGPHNIWDGVVAMANWDKPSLERPGLSFLGKTLYTTFGLEGVNNGVGATTREELAMTILQWSMDEPSVAISHTAEISTSNASMFTIEYTSPITDSYPVSYRWDWGDGSSYTPEYPIVIGGPPTVYEPLVLHRYEECGEYTVRVEVTNSYGNTILGEQNVTVTACQPEATYNYYLPFIFKN